MKKINFDIVLNKIDTLRKMNITSFQTNFFRTPVNKEVLCSSNNKAVLFLSKDRDIYRVYYAFIELSSFEKLLQELPEELKLSLEIITKNSVDSSLFDTINKYLPYETTFKRLRCKVADLRYSKVYTESDIDFAEPKEAKKIQNLMSTTFNHFSSHLPDDDELIDLISRKQAIVLRDESGEIKTLYLFKLNGTTANFDQFINLDKNSLSALTVTDQFCSRLKALGIKSVYNWVDIKNNVGAYKFYQFYGYKPDGIENIIFINDTLKKVSI